jgi:hypothetical protein
MFAFVTYTGCVNDEENPDNVASKLIGLWTISDAQIDATIGGLSITDFLIDMGLSEVEAAAFTLLFNQALLANFSGTIEFKANNTYVTNIGGDTDDGTWSMNAAGDEITLDAGTIDEQVIDIISLTSNIVVVGFSQTEYEDIDDEPLTPDIPIDMTIELTLTK